MSPWPRLPRWSTSVRVHCIETSRTAVLLEAAVASSFDDAAPMATSNGTIAGLIADSSVIAVRFRETGLPLVPGSQESTSRSAHGFACAT